MKTIAFEGSSDDLIEVSISGFGAQVDEEYNADMFGSFVMAAFVVAGTGGGVRVYSVYGRGGVWSFAISRLDEGTPLPEWPIRVTGKDTINNYTVRLEIDVPDDAVLTHEK